MNEIIPVNTHERFILNWSFLAEGYIPLISPKVGGYKNLTQKEYQRILLCASVSEQVGGVLLLQSAGRKKPLGFVCLVDDSTFVHPMSLSIFTIYSNEKCPSTYEELAFEAQKWARMRGYQRLTHNCHRISGAAKSFGQRKLKLDPTSLHFELHL